DNSVAAPKEQKEERPVKEDPAKKKENKKPVPTKSRTSTRPSAEYEVQSSVLPGRNDNRFYSPLVEKIAREHHISYEELARIPSTGNDNRLRKSDIFKYLEEGRPAQFIQSAPVQQGGNFQIPDLQFDKG